MRWARRCAALVLSGFLLCSCTITKPNNERSLSPVGKVLTLEVDGDLGADILAKSKSFANRVEQLSNGKLIINVETGGAGEQNLLQGTCDLAFLSSQQASQADDIFSTLSLPFFYDDAAHMSLALNSEEMTDILTSRLSQKNLMPLAAIYNGSPCFITKKGLLRSPSDFKKLVMVLNSNSVPKADAFRMLDADVSTYPMQSVIEVFNKEERVRDENGNNIGRVEAVELELQQVPELSEDPNDLFLIRTSHAIIPLWFMANAQSISNLSDFEQAVLREASAGLIADMEQIWQETESNLIRQFKDQGITVVDAERLEFAAAIYDNKEPADLPPYFDWQVYRTIQLFID